MKHRKQVNEINTTKEQTKSLLYPLVMRLYAEFSTDPILIQAGDEVVFLFRSIAKKMLLPP